MSVTPTVVANDTIRVMVLMELGRYGSRAQFACIQTARYNNYNY